MTTSRPPAQKMFQLAPAANSGMNGAGDKAKAKECCIKKLFFDAQAYAISASDYTPNGSDGFVRIADGDVVRCTISALPWI